MVYELGGIIEAADYNQLIVDINKIFGTGDGDFGYGGNSFGNLPTTTNLSSLLQGESVDNQSWLDLRNAIDDCANHQGTILTDGLPSVIDIEDGDPASFFPRLASSQNLFDITTNRFNNGSLPTIVNALTSIRGVEATTGPGVLPWGNFIQHEFTVTFINSDHARHFFNTGGSLRISAQRTGGSATIKNAAWDDILIPSNTFVFDQEIYAGLTSSFTDLRPQISPLGFGIFSVYSALGAYSASNIWTMQGKRDDAQGPNGGNGSIIRISSNFLDGNPNAPDIVDGKFTSSIDEHKFDSVFNIQSPTYQSIKEVTLGN